MSTKVKMGLSGHDLGRKLALFILLMLPASWAIARQNVLLISVVMTMSAGIICDSLIAGMGLLLAKAGRVGRDLNKVDRPYLPESLGLVVGSVYLGSLFLFLPLPFLLHSHEVPFRQLGEYTAALLSLSCMLLLGFADDVLNLKWRHKVALPAMASLPLLMLYSMTAGGTQVVVPWPLRGLLGQHLIDLGSLYYAYMAALSIFCTHSINILAGVNGVEVGQTIIIALFVLAHATLGILRNGPMDQHLFTIYLTLPFLGCAMALLRHNWWPAKCFVGDTFCYFAGMLFASVAILSHSGKTLLLAFIPQAINFIYSCPQLFGVVSCPRHRLPRLNHRTGLLEPSVCVVQENGVWSRLESWGLIKRYRGESGELQINNLTLLNWLLVRFGPMREDRLCMLMLTVQSFTCGLGLLLRHHLAEYFFPV